MGPKEEGDEVNWYFCSNKRQKPKRRQEDEGSLIGKGTVLGDDNRKCKEKLFGWIGTKMEVSTRLDGMRVRSIEWE